MWRNLSKIATSLELLATENVLHQQLRTTFILKRRTAPFLSKQGYPLKKLRSRHYVYELVKDTSVEKQSDIDVILTSYVDGLGNPGDRITTKPTYAYNKLLLPGLAVYATSENLEKLNTVERKAIKQYSSHKVLQIIEALQRIRLSVIMNKDSPWTIQPWHIRASFRKCGYVVPEDAITIPKKNITGPDMALEGKEFYITVTINNTEKVDVRCRLHHWSTDVTKKLPYVENFWKDPHDFLFSEDAEKYEKLKEKNE